jgi:hypothetical protein
MYLLETGVNVWDRMQETKPERKCFHGEVFSIKENEQLPWDGHVERMGRAHTWLEELICWNMWKGTQWLGEIYKAVKGIGMT